MVVHFSVDWEYLSQIDELNAELWMRKTNYLKVSLLGWTYTKRGISRNYKKNIEIYSLPLWPKVKQLIKINILKQTGITLRTHGKE